MPRNLPGELVTLGIRCRANAQALLRRVQMASDLWRLNRALHATLAGKPKPARRISVSRQEDGSSRASPRG